MPRLLSLFAVVVCAFALSCGGGSETTDPTPPDPDVSTDTTPPCVPVCTDLDCGDDGCGGTCGVCNEGQTCTAGVCDTIVEACEGDECCEPGDAGQTYCAQKFNDCSRCLAEGKCSQCAMGQICLPTAECCTPSCTDDNDNPLECGNDGCGGKCGVCAMGENCTAQGICSDGPCVPLCEGKQCGDDGCGATCGECESGDVCNATSGQCESFTPPSEGDTCMDPILVDSFPYNTTGNTLGYTPDYGYSSNACPGETGSWGAGSADVVYAFTPAATDYYGVQLLAEYDGNLYVVSDCNNVDGSCLGADDEIGSNLEESVNAYLTAGTTYFIIVDGWSNSSDVNGPYTLTIGPGCTPTCEAGACGDDGCGGVCPCVDGQTCVDSLCCTPSCDGKACGDDGCGGNCGYCPGETEVCLEGICCVPECSDEICGNADGCGGTCGCSNGLVCSDSTCVEPPTECAPIQQVACGDVLPGQSNNIEGATKAFSKYTCQDWSSDDFTDSLEITYEFLADQDAIVTVEGENDSSLYVTVLQDVGNGCEDATTNCLVQDAYKAQFNATAGNSYFFVWDSWQGAAVSDFTMTVTCCTPTCDFVSCGADNGCGGTCGCEDDAVCFQSACCVPSCDNVTCNNDDGCGGTCECGEGAICQEDACKVLSSECAPAMIINCEDNLTELSNAMEGATMAFDGYSCQNNPLNSYDLNKSPELTMEFVAEHDGYVTIKGTDDSSLDLFTLKDACEDTEETCVGENSSSTKLKVIAGDLYYFVWDSWQGQIIDNFSVSVECCTPACDGTTCGDDGCGEICECADETQVCFQGQCAEPALGDTCEDPIVIASLPYLDTNDNGGAFGNQYSSGGYCGNTSDFGDDEPDVVYVYTPDVSGSYKVTMPGYTKSDGASVVWVTTDCDDFTTTCLGVIDFYNSSDPAVDGLTVELEAGVTAFLFVDSYFSSEIGPYNLQLDGPL